MKKTVFIFALISALNLYSQSAEDLARTGDQLYLDGFASLSWAKYEKALERTQDEKLKFRLLVNLAKTSKNADKLNETLKEIITFIASSGTKLEKSNLAALYLNSSLLQLELGQYNKAFESSMKLKKDFNELPAAITGSLLETAVYALVKNSKAEEASKLIEEYQKSFTDQTKMDLENARLKIMLSQYVNAITILGKYIESKDPLPHFLSMWAYLKSGDTNKSYDQRLIDEAKSQLILFTQQFTSHPMLSEAERRLKQIYNIEAERLYLLALFYNRKDTPHYRPAAAKKYLYKLLIEYGESDFADPAKEILATIDPEYQANIVDEKEKIRKEMEEKKLILPPEATDPSKRKILIKQGDSDKFLLPIHDLDLTPLENKKNEEKKDETK